MKMRCCVTTFGQTDVQLITKKKTKKQFLPFRVLLNVGIDPNFPQKILVSFLALFEKKIAFRRKHFLAQQRLAQSFTI